VGAWILSMSIANGQTVWSGIGDYHSHTKSLNQDYQQKVFRQFQQVVTVLAPKMTL
jgi:hypothetical protein